MAGEVVVRPVHGLPEIRPDDDLATLLAAALEDLADGDIVVVSSKIVSKAEGRVVEGVDRSEAVDDETARLVAERGATRIVQTRHGFVMAAAGVDNSNVALGSLVLLPLDPDGSARALRRELTRRLGLQRIGVLVTDTFGRPWRLGQTDLAIGAAGVLPLGEYAGRTDAHGNQLAVTAPAYADELSAAADLVKAKLAQVPVAVVSGLPHLVTAEDGPGVRALVRPAEDDLFSLGTREAMRAAVRLPWRDRGLTDAPYDQEAVRRIVAEFSPSFFSSEAGGLPPAEFSPVSPEGRTAVPEGTSQPESAPFRFRELRAVEETKPLLDAAGLPSTALLLALEPSPGTAQVAGGDEQPAAGAARGEDLPPEHVLAAGAALDRLRLALVVDGFGVAGLHPPDPSYLALLAVGAPRR